MEENYEYYILNNDCINENRMILWIIILINQYQITNFFFNNSILTDCSRL